MFEDLVHDLATTLSERFLRLQVRVDAPPAPPPSMLEAPQPGNGRPRSTRRYNALGILEDVPERVAAEETDSEAMAPAAAARGGSDTSEDGAETAPVARAEVVGLKKPQPMNAPQADWSNVGRNDPCPCGSGKKYKKCHGVNS